jgi:anti-sigma B factor antagonist
MFSMDLGSGESGGYVVVALHGELDLVHATAVADALVTVAACEPWIIVDLSRLEFIDASGIAALRCGRSSAREAGGDLLLAAPQRQVQRVLAIIWRASDADLPPAGQRQPPAGEASRPAAAPIRRHRPRRAVGASSDERTGPRRCPVAGYLLAGGLRASCRRPPGDGD